MKKTVVTALAGLAITLGGVAVSAPSAAAAPASASASQTYDVGYYNIWDCNAQGQYLQAYYGSQGYQVRYTCIYVNGFPPYAVYLLRVTLSY
ncbi:hypothetical protein [Kitasatospora sp. NPDC090091]|uniref:hypothetical protein n=1 Tax=Kitasatospora sp. NPDC090091 TaxID=3364081 RepID=UPI0037F4EE3F